MKIYVATAAAVASGIAHLVAQAAPAAAGGDAVSVNTLVNAIGAVLLGVVAWLVQLGVRSVLDRLNDISRRLRRVELVIATKLGVDPPDDECDTEVDEE